MTRSTRWGISAAIIVCVFLVGIAMAWAQTPAALRENVSIRHVEPDENSEPFPVLPVRGNSVMHVGGLYEVSFTGPVYVPGLGERQKLFVMVERVAREGWFQVAYGDRVQYKGATNARIDPAVDLPDSVPPAPATWMIHYTAIAAVSPPLNVGGPQAQYWPE